MLFQQSPIMMQKILRPRISEVIDTPEKVEEYKPFLIIHAGNEDWLTGKDGLCITISEIESCKNMPYVVQDIMPCLFNCFVTKVELEQAEAFNPITSQFEALQERSAKLHNLEGWETFKEDAEAFAKAVEYFMDDLNETLELANELVNQAELHIDELGKHEPTYEQEGEIEYIRAIGG